MKAPKLQAIQNIYVENLEAEGVVSGKTNHKFHTLDANNFRNY